MEHRKRSGGGGDDEDDADRIGKVMVKPWNPYSSSRIVRVSRASGGKDRHSKVLTAKGLRDRRVRLSVSTAIQFYDLQDRLGVDQPSKAVDWLIRAAEPAITQLPSLPEFDHPHQNQNHLHPNNGTSHDNNNNNHCSSTSETSKGSASGSVLSLSRTDIRVKPRERAKEKEKNDTTDREEEGHAVAVNGGGGGGGGTNLSSQSSFTELLAGGGEMEERKPMTADYFGQFGVVGGGEQLQQFSYLQEHVIPMEYGINFSLSSGLAGLSRGTLQSNSSPSSHFPHHHHHHQVHHHGVEGGSLSLPFFFGAPASAAAGENHFANGFSGRYGDGYGQSELKGKGKG